MQKTYATGRRKSSTARVFIKKGSGEITIIARPLDQYFGRGTKRGEHRVYGCPAEG